MQSTCQAQEVIGTDVVEEGRQQDLAAASLCGTAWGMCREELTAWDHRSDAKGEKQCNLVLPLNANPYKPFQDEL